MKYHPDSNASKNAHISSLDQYREMYERSIADPDKFWSEIAERIDWYEKWHTVREFDFVNPEIAWYKGGKLNITYNCLDRHVKAGNGDNTAIIWEGNNPDES
ncbi:MAG: hypothetical protein KDH98_07290, partial [Calditrichaeota bacterium]|nr:hypothetical protein [Calditrichota bacterium]